MRPLERWPVLASLGWLGTEMDAYLEGEGNLERWVAGPKEGGLQGWEKRVLVTNLAAAAWEKYNPYT